MNSEYHVPVLLDESISALDIKPEGVYVDVTFGAGGHSRSILNRLGAKGYLYSFDQDEDAFANVWQDDRFTLIKSNFRYLKKWMKYYQIDGVDGILADLGVSSHQFDESSRGFSYRMNAPVDMRMNQSQKFSAEDILKTYSEGALVQIFSDYGQIRNSKQLARFIVDHRADLDLSEMSALVKLIEKVRIGPVPKYYAQVMQALRIEVNEEMQALADFFEDSKEVLSDRGRLVVISYHSLEDKMAKNFISTGNKEGVQNKDEYGNIERPFKKVGKAFIVPEDSEIKRNRRATSAKMRVAERIK